MGAIFDAIQDKLNSAFQPTRLEIEDDSGRHAGHSGAREGGESHFNVLIQSAAFAGAWRLLKPGGLLILTVPYIIESNATLEHFPDLHEWALTTGDDGVHRLRNRRVDGTVEEFDQLVFHGGPGSTLEMRIFSRDSLLGELASAGFDDVRIADEPMPPIGVLWQHPWSLPVVARK